MNLKQFNSYLREAATDCDHIEEIVWSVEDGNEVIEHRVPDSEAVVLAFCERRNKHLNFNVRPGEYHVNAINLNRNTDLAVAI